MAFEADSPFGITWAYVVLALGAVAFLVALVFGAVERGGIRRWRNAAALAFTIVAVAWNAVSIDYDVTVSDGVDPGPVYCVIDPFGDEPDHTVDWQDD